MRLTIKKEWLLVRTVAGDDPFEFPVVFSYDECTEFIDVNRITFETVLEGTDLDPVFESTGHALPFLDNCIVFPAFDEKITTFKFFENTGKERGTVNLMPDLSTDSGNAVLEGRRKIVQVHIHVNTDSKKAMMDRIGLCRKL